MLLHNITRQQIVVDYVDSIYVKFKIHKILLDFSLDKNKYFLFLFNLLKGIINF